MKTEAQMGAMQPQAKEHSPDPPGPPEAGSSRSDPPLETLQGAQASQHPTP